MKITNTNLAVLYYIRVIYHKYSDAECLLKRLKEIINFFIIRNVIN